MAFTTLDPVNKGSFTTLSGGNLTVGCSAGSPTDSVSRSLISFTGKVHFEVTVTAAPSNQIYTVIGVCDALANLNNFVGSDTHSYGINLASAEVYGGGTHAQLSPLFNLITGDTVAVEIDAAGPTIQYQKVGGGAGWEVGTASGLPTGGTLYAAVEVAEASGSMTVNFGASTFLVSPSDGYAGLSDGSTSYILMGQACL
jgi:hypothetical protein